MLFSVRSRYLFAIGLETCLVLAIDAGHVHEEFPIPDTLELTHALLAFVTGLSPCIALRFRRLHENVQAMRVSPNTTLPEGFGLDWVAFTRSYLRHPIRFLFLPVLRCFNFRRSPLRKAIARGFPLGNPEFFASVRLPQAYRSLARPSSALEPSHPPAGTVATLLESHCDPVNSDPVDAWIALTYGRHRHVSVVARACIEPFPPALSRSGASVFRTRTFRRHPLKGSGFVPAREYGPTGIRTQGILLAKEALYR